MVADRPIDDAEEVSGLVVEASIFLSSPLSRREAMRRAAAGATPLPPPRALSSLRGWSEADPIAHVPSVGSTTSRLAEDLKENHGRE